MHWRHSVFLPAIVGLLLLSGGCRVSKSEFSPEELKMAKVVAADFEPDFYCRGRGTPAEFMACRFYTLRSARWAVRDERTRGGIPYPDAVKQLADFYREFQKGETWKEKPRRIAFPQLDAAPVLDGRLAPEEWKGAAAFLGEYPIGSAEPDRNYPDSRWYVGIYRDALYVGAGFRDSDVRISSGTSFDEPDPMYRGDSLEIFVRPDTDRLLYREFLVNPDGKCWELRHKASPFGQWDMLDSRVDSGMEARTSTGPDGFCFEVKIPLRFELGARWSFMLVRGNRDSDRECRYSMPVPLLYDSHNIYGYIVVDR